MAFDHVYCKINPDVVHKTIKPIFKDLEVVQLEINKKSEIELQN